MRPYCIYFVFALRVIYQRNGHLMHMRNEILGLQIINLSQLYLVVRLPS
jgi:hypothetical protein